MQAMELVGVIARPSVNHIGRVEAHLSNRCSYPSGNLFNQSRRNFYGKICVGIGNLSTIRPRIGYVSARRSSEIANFACLKYEISSKKKEKEKSCEMKSAKKKLKLIKRLSRDMSMVSDLAIDSENIFLGEVRGKMLSEAIEFLMTQLQQMKIEQMIMKKKKKEELNFKKCKSNSSSESSDGECEKVINMNNSFKSSIESQHDEQVNDAVKTELRSQSPSVEICMGGKGKKMGAMALIEEFEKKIGDQGAVVGCKCMGKCRTGPNVKLQNHTEEIQNPLYLDVNIEDVEEIVATLFRISMALSLKTLDSADA